MEDTTMTLMAFALMFENRLIGRRKENPDESRRGFTIGRRGGAGENRGAGSFVSASRSTHPMILARTPEQL